MSLKDVYDFDPTPPSLTPEQQEHIIGLQANIWTEHIRPEERVDYAAFPRAAALAELAWSPASEHNWQNFLTQIPAQFDRYRALGIAHSEAVLAQSADMLPALRRDSHELKLCSNSIALSLEDDAPLDGPRATFLVDIMNPCWIFPHVDLSGIGTIKAGVGQLPFNFQIGDDIHKIALLPPATPDGELEVHIDSCTGERIALLPLAPAVANDAVTTLSAADRFAPGCPRFVFRLHAPQCRSHLGNRLGATRSGERFAKGVDIVQSRAGRADAGLGGTARRGARSGVLRAHSG